MTQKSTNSLVSEGKSKELVLNSGTPETIRTSDPSLRRRMLYPLSYRGILTCTSLLERPAIRIGRKKWANLCVLRRRTLYPAELSGLIDLCEVTRTGAIHIQGKTGNLCVLKEPDTLSSELLGRIKLPNPIVTNLEPSVNAVIRKNKNYCNCGVIEI